MTTIDPNVARWNLDYQNNPLPADFKALLDYKTSLDGQILNMSVTHPSRASLVTQQATVVAAINNHPKRAK